MKSWEEMRQDIRNNPKLNEAEKKYLLDDIDNLERMEKASAEAWKNMSEDERQRHRDEMDEYLLL